MRIQQISAAAVVIKSRDSNGDCQVMSRVNGGPVHIPVSEMGPELPDLAQGLRAELSLKN